MNSPKVENHSNLPESERTVHSADEVDCPRCGGLWYTDLEPGSNLPYTCFRCGNGTYRLTRADLADAEVEQGYDAGQRACMAELADYHD
jgi:DNA-directed RNA polymerase subunit RPC12/RpoP